MNESYLKNVYEMLD